MCIVIVSCDITEFGLLEGVQLLQFAVTRQSVVLWVAERAVCHSWCCFYNCCSFQKHPNLHSPSQFKHLWYRKSWQAEIHSLLKVHFQANIQANQSNPISSPWNCPNWYHPVLCLQAFHVIPFFILVFSSCMLESFLRNRSSLDHEATAMMKAQFMSLWDGIETSSTTQVTQPELVLTL